MWAGGVDHHGGIQRVAALQGHANDPSVILPYANHLRVEQERRPLGFGGALQVVAGQLRIVDVTRGRDEDGSGNRFSGRVAEGVVVGTLGRIECRGIAEGELGL